jgi:hypothetical protein
MGFLGTLHCSVFEDRLRQEHGASIIITPASIIQNQLVDAVLQVLEEIRIHWVYSHKDHRFGWVHLLQPWHEAE